MTAPFLSLAQIRNRLALTARRINRDQTGQEVWCPVCGASVTDVLRALEKVQQRSTATVPAEAGRTEHQQPG
ncbi:hypothetical protein [Micromonospora maris]|uniref:hypothetical protein n=1 Tax=Micromonospora maris TaxID=1003110 RepID=UPI002E0E8A9D|nr:hypothetical protein OG712_15530 [Micromonospora maris]